MIKNKVNQNGFSAVVVVLLAVIIGIIAFTSWYVYDTAQNNRDANKAAAIANYEQCLRAEDSITTQNIPEECIVRGETYTNPNRGPNKAAPTPTKKYETADWLTYTSSKYKYSFKYPKSGYSLSSQAEQLDSQNNIAYISLEEDRLKDQFEYPGLFGVTIHQKSANTTLDKWITQDGKEPSNYVSSLKAQMVAGKSGYYFVYGGMIGGYAYAAELSPTQVLIITTIENTDTFKSILNTFKIN